MKYVTLYFNITQGCNIIAKQRNRLTEKEESVDLAKDLLTVEGT